MTGLATYEPFFWMHRGRWYIVWKTSWILCSSSRSTSIYGILHGILWTSSSTVLSSVCANTKAENMYHYVSSSHQLLCSSAIQSGPSRKPTIAAWGPPMHYISSSFPFFECPLPAYFRAARARPLSLCLVVSLGHSSARAQRMPVGRRKRRRRRQSWFGGGTYRIRGAAATLRPCHCRRAVTAAFTHTHIGVHPELPY